MTAATLTLTDFLLARIAEDERQSSWHHRLLCLRTACDAECCWGEATDEQIAAERVCTCGYPARVLAECEAKRRIVRAYQSADASSGVDFELGFGLDLAVRVLAAIYADHADYREEWRP